MIELNPLRRRILQTAYHAGEGHIPSALSILEIVHTLHVSVMRAADGTLLDKANWRAPGADQFVLSKGHGCLALYAVLEACGFITADDMVAFCKPGGKLGGHPCADNVPGVWASTGSLGHGLPIAVGMAYAKTLRREKGLVFCLVGDGEMQEGSCWEALRLADDLYLENLRVIVDKNGTHDTMTLGYHQSASDALDNLAGIRDDSYRISLVDTVKGKGIARMEEDPDAWHRRRPTPQEYREMMEELA